LKGIKELANRYPGEIKNARGRGTFCAFDCTSMEKRDAMVEMLKRDGNKFFKLIYIYIFKSRHNSCNKYGFSLPWLGIQTGGAGPIAIRLRPSLVFQPQHAAIFLDRLEKTVKKAGGQ